MKDRILNNDKVIPFPQLEYRLLKKGMDCLQEGRFDEAIDLLRQAREFLPEHPELLYSLTAAFIKKGELHEAEEIVETMLRRGIGDYFTTIELYIGILFQKGNYRAVEEIVQMLLEEQQIPFAKIEQYHDLLTVCRNLTDNEDELQVTHKKKDLPENLFHGNWNEVIQNIGNLTEEDLPRYISEIKNYLVDDSANFFLKTALLHALYEIGFDEVLTVKKFGKTVRIRLPEYAPPQESPFALEVKSFIEDRLAHENPTLMNNALILAERFFFNIYPLEKEFTDVALWGEALLAVVRSYIDADMRVPEEVDSEKVRELIQFIKSVEEKFDLPLE